MSKIHKIFLTFTLSCLIFSGSMGQGKSVYDNMSLSEILNLDVVVTASKKPEDLFEAPLSTTIIKKEDIVNSGAFTIPEALRLSPGLIVREITPGNYDVQIRGFDDITKNAYVSLPFNTTTLVMIDNRIVYSYFSGGTFWETFPIDLNDVERIEVVRGPASALYGPNAVTGVINIITSQAGEQGMNVYSNASLGTNKAKNASTNIGYNWNDKTKLSFSGNFTERRRFDVEYFDRTTQSYTSLDNQHILLRIEKDINTHELWTAKDYRELQETEFDEEISLRKLGGNIFFQHNFSERKNIDIAFGVQQSQSLKTGFQNFVTPISQINSESWYLNNRIKYNDFYAQFNAHSGKDLSNYQANSYKFTNFDVNLEYFKQFKSLSIRPGISYKHVAYDSPITYDEPYKITTLNFSFKDEPRVINSFAASLLSEWKPISKLRIIGAIRLDKFSINNNLSYNYEIASTYRINKNNLLRYVSSKANRSPFIFDTYLNSNFSLNVEYVSVYEQDPITIPVELKIHASKNLKLPAIINQEIGWRTKMNSSLSLDVEMFYSKYKEVIVSNVNRYADMLEHIDQSGNADYIYSINSVSDMVFENEDLVAQQYGASFELSYKYGDKLNAKIFGTYQKTKLTGKKETEFELRYLNIEEIKADNTRSTELISDTNPTQWSEKLTPSYYGGLILNYKYNNSWTFNTDAYFTSSQKFIDFDYNRPMADFSGIYTNYHMDIEPSIVWNAKVSFNVNKNITTYGTLKNILGTHREFGYADQIGRLFMIGINWKL